MGSGLKPAQRAQQQAVCGAGGAALYQEVVHQLSNVESAGYARQIAAEAAECGDGVGFVDDVQVSAHGYGYGYAVEQFQVAAESAFGAADALGDGAYLADVRGAKGQDTIRLAQRRLSEHHCFGAICTWLRHRRC